MQLNPVICGFDSRQLALRRGIGRSGTKVRFPRQRLGVTLKLRSREEHPAPLFLRHEAAGVSQSIELCDGDSQQLRSFHSLHQNRGACGLPHQRTSRPSQSGSAGRGAWCRSYRKKQVGATTWRVHPIQVCCTLHRYESGTHASAYRQFTVLRGHYRTLPIASELFAGQETEMAS